jgi:hypothetical protein
MTTLTLWTKRLLASAVVVLGTSGGAVAGPGNAVVQWNAVATQAFIPTQGSDPLTQSITYAMLHAAIHDALNAIEQRYESYTPGLFSMPGASAEAAIAAAARDVLVARIPTQQGGRGLPEDAAYAHDFAYVKAVGDVNSTTRTTEQSLIARFWYEDSPIGWNRIAGLVLGQQSVDLWEAARILALVNFAMADGFIAGFAIKYEDRFWRPVTAIREAAFDGNRFTEADETWSSYMITPPVPDYPSTHTVLGAAATNRTAYLSG